MISNKNINLDVLKAVLDATTPANLAKINVSGDFNLVPTPLTRDQACAAKRMHARWQAHTTGNTYVLYVQNRTSDHSFRVIGHGKNPWQAVLRYYKGLDNKGSWVWQCTKVVAVYSCVCDKSTQAGDLLVGQAQDRAPW